MPKVTMINKDLGGKLLTQIHQLQDLIEKSVLYGGDPKDIQMYRSHLHKMREQYRRLSHESDLNHRQRNARAAHDKRVAREIARLS